VLPSVLDVQDRLLRAMSPERKRLYPLPRAPEDDGYQVHDTRRAAIIYGEPRLTNDADTVIVLGAERAEALV
jgi:hypothetical protein